MSDIFQNAADIAKDAVRDTLCALGGTQRVALDVASKLNPRYRGSALERFYERQNRALKSFCPLPPQEDVPNVVPGFNGGQCPGAPYRVSGTWDLFGADGTLELSSSFSNQVVLGPISIRPSDTRPGQLFLFWTDSQGNPRENFLGGSSNTSKSIVLTSANVVRTDGMPDDCGNPPPNPLPPGSPTPTDPVRPSTDITIDLPDIGPNLVVFAPVVGIIYADVDARIKIPVKVNINIPAINFNFDIDFNVDLNDPTADPEPVPIEPETDDDGRNIEDDCPEPPECNEESEEEEPGDEDEDERDAKGTEVVGAIVKSVRNIDQTRATEISQDDAPNIWAPAIGFINFVYLEPDSDTEVFSSDIPVKNVNNVIRAPEVGLVCQRVVGTPNQGFSWELFQVVGRRNRGGCSGSES